MVALPDPVYLEPHIPLVELETAAQKPAAVVKSPKNCEFPRV